MACTTGNRTEDQKTTFEESQRDSGEYHNMNTLDTLDKMNREEKLVLEDSKEVKLSSKIYQRKC